jgi:hypothetical protein
MVRVLCKNIGEKFIKNHPGNKEMQCLAFSYWRLISATYSTLKFQKSPIIDNDDISRTDNVCKNKPTYGTSDKSLGMISNKPNAPPIFDLYKIIMQPVPFNASEIKHIRNFL